MPNRPLGADGPGVVGRDRPDRIQGRVRLCVERIALGAQAMAVDASGSVEGILNNDSEDATFRVSELGGRLRVLTYSGSVWGATVKNRLTILDRSTLVPWTWLTS